MSGNELDSIVNSTPIHPIVPKPPLTNGQVAAITIATTFVFFLTMMVAVCAGEYWKYLNGKKKKHNFQRKRVTASTSAKLAEDSARNQVYLPGQHESSVSQSDFISSSSTRDSDSSGESGHRQRHSSAVEGSNAVMLNTESYIRSNSIEVNFDEALERVNLDCVNKCNEPSSKMEEQVVMVPLILRQCDEAVDMDGEILCESVDSGDQFQLEADV